MTSNHGTGVCPGEQLCDIKVRSGCNISSRHGGCTPGYKARRTALACRSGWVSSVASSRRSRAPDRAQNAVPERRPSPTRQQRRTARRECSRPERTLVVESYMVPNKVVVKYGE